MGKCFFRHPLETRLARALIASEACPPRWVHPPEAGREETSVRFRVKDGELTMD